MGTLCLMSCTLFSLFCTLSRNVKKQKMFQFGSTLHYGIDYTMNGWPKAHFEKNIKPGFNEDFHNYQVRRGSCLPCELLLGGLLLCVS